MVNLIRIIVIEKTTGHLRGKLTEEIRRRNLEERNAKITIISEGRTIETSIKLKSVLTPHPVISSYNETITILAGIHNDELVYSVVFGYDLTYSIDPLLPEGLHLNEKDGFIYGRTLKETSKNYTICVTNGKEPYYMTILIQTVINDDPILLNNPENITLYYEVDYDRDTVDILVKNLEYSVDFLPSGLSYSKTNGSIYGIIKYDDDDNDKQYTLNIKVSSKTGSIPVNIKLELYITLPPYPLLLSEEKSIFIPFGKIIDNINMYKVIGKNLEYSVSKRINGLIFNLTESAVSGKINEKVVSERVIFTIKGRSKTVIVEKKIKIVSIVQPSITIIKNDEILYPITIIDVQGENKNYEISPNFPSGLSLNKNNGMLSGLVKEESEMKNYTITVSNEYGKESAVFELEVVILYCEKDGRWPKSEIGRIILNCNGEGLTYRDCVKNGNKAEWRNEVDTCKEKKDYTGMIIGIAVVVVVVVIIVSIGLVYYLTKTSVSYHKESKKKTIHKIEMNEKTKKPIINM